MENSVLNPVLTFNCIESSVTSDNRKDYVWKQITDFGVNVLCCFFFFFFFSVCALFQTNQLSYEVLNLPRGTTSMSSDVTGHLKARLKQAARWGICCCAWTSSPTDSTISTLSLVGNVHHAEETDDSPCEKQNRERFGKEDFKPAHMLGFFFYVLFLGLPQQKPLHASIHLKETLWRVKLKCLRNGTQCLNFVIRLQILVTVVTFHVQKDVRLTCSRRDAEPLPHTCRWWEQQVQVFLYCQCLSIHLVRSRERPRPTPLQAT